MDTSTYFAASFRKGNYLFASLHKEILSKKVFFAPTKRTFFPLKQTPYEQRGKHKNDRTALPETQSS